MLLPVLQSESDQVQSELDRVVVMEMVLNARRRRVCPVGASLTGCPPNKRMVETQTYRAQMEQLSRNRLQAPVPPMLAPPTHVPRKCFQSSTRSIMVHLSSGRESVCTSCYICPCTGGQSTVDRPGREGGNGVRRPKWVLVMVLVGILVVVIGALIQRWSSVARDWTGASP